LDKLKLGVNLEQESQKKGVKFINVLRANFLYKMLAQKLQSCVVGLKFWGQKYLRKKRM